MLKSFFTYALLCIFLTILTGLTGCNTDTQAPELQDTSKAKQQRIIEENQAKLQKATTF
jgi:hypothetical protein